MKKVLSLVIALVMVLSLGVTAVAAPQSHVVEITVTQTLVQDILQGPSQALGSNPFEWDIDGGATAPTNAAMLIEAQTQQSPPALLPANVPAAGDTFGAFQVFANATISNPTSWATTGPEIWPTTPTSGRIVWTRTFDVAFTVIYDGAANPLPTLNIAINALGTAFSTAATNYATSYTFSHAAYTYTPNGNGGNGGNGGGNGGNGGNGGGNGQPPPPPGTCTTNPCRVVAAGHSLFAAEGIRFKGGDCIIAVLDGPVAPPAGYIAGNATLWGEFLDSTASLQIATVGTHLVGGQRFGASGVIRSMPAFSGVQITLNEIRDRTAPIEAPIVTAAWRRAGQAPVLFTLYFTCCTWHPAPAAAVINQLPNSWRVDGVTSNGQGRIQGLLDSIMTMTGDATERIPVIPSDFTWRIPQRDFPGGAQSGFATGVEWANAATLIGPLAYSDYDTPSVLRSIHFDRMNLRTNRAVNTSGTIYDVDMHFGEGNMAIRIRTIEFMVRTGTTTVEFDLNAQITGGSTRNIARAIIEVGNTRVYVYEGDDSISITHTEYIRGGDHVRGLEIYAGVGVYFTRNVTARHSIYVQASLATHDAWHELFQRHAELVDIIKIWETGMLHAASQVRIDRADTFFVYDSEFRLIGTTADNNLPFSPYYFLTTAQVNLGGATTPEIPVGPEIDDPEVPVTGGDGGTNANVNMNPGTGR